jgi:hypothetical protein
LVSDAVHQIVNIVDPVSVDGPRTARLSHRVSEPHSALSPQVADTDSHVAVYSQESSQDFFGDLTHLEMPTSVLWSNTEHIHFSNVSDSERKAGFC